MSVQEQGCAAAPAQTNVPLRLSAHAHPVRILGTTCGVILQKVAKAVRTGKNVDTRFSPDWSLLVMHHPGFGTTSVSLQPAVDGAAAVAMSWRGAKGVTLSGGEWLMLDALLPRVRESINSLKDPVRPWVDASTWRRGAEEQPADAAGTAPS